MDALDDERGQVSARLIRVPRQKSKDAAAQIMSRQLNLDKATRDLVLSGKLIMPPFPLTALARLPQESSILGPCITAMEVNVDGFGYDFSYVGPKGEEKSKASIAELAGLRQFFAAINPNESFTDLRRKMRRDYEATGCGFFEIIRDVDGTMVQWEHVPAASMFLGPQDEEPVTVDLTFQGADGQEVTRTVRQRFRRFCQRTRTAHVWFKEYGDPRTLDCKKGEFVPEGSIPLAQRATEVIYFRQYDSSTPYGIPRYLGALISVRGSRQAERVNWLFFEKNAIPAMVITVSGGHLVKSTIAKIEAFLKENAGGAENAHSVLLLEGLPGSGDDDEEGGNVKIDVKPLYAERQQDALFQEYDDANRAKGRQAWRLPLLYVGASEDMNFAVAQAARLTAEEQIFTPERNLFDDAINRRVLGERKARFWAFFTKGPAIVDMGVFSAAVDAFNAVGAMTPNAAIGLARELLGYDLPDFEQPWGNMPFPIVLELARAGSLAGIEDIVAEQPFTSMADRLVQSVSDTPDGTPPDDKQVAAKRADVLALADAMRRMQGTFEALVRSQKSAAATGAAATAGAPARPLSVARTARR